MWGICVKELDKKVYKEFKTFKEAKSFVGKVRKKYEDREFVSVHLFSKLKAFPKPKGKLRPGYIWCPYCAKQRRFKEDKELGVRRCPICVISDRDYHVKRENKLRWG